MSEKWYQKAYRRNVVDMHIADWDERFMSEFDPVVYADTLALSDVQSAVVYAHSHAGHAYYPTSVGHMHRGLKGRDIFGEVTDELHKRGIGVVAYFSLIFDDWAYENNPDWRMVLADGHESAENNRYGVCCPNSPYRDYAAAYAIEICEKFEVEGIRFDMTFWPTVCYCKHCREKFGGDLPKVIDWINPDWVRFQRKREDWMTEFAALITSTVKRLKPDMSVEHQASTLPLSWTFGVTGELAKQNDFLQGDFYGDALQGSFVRKILYNLTEQRPFAFETSRCVGLGNHTSTKSEELVRAKAYSCLADGGAFVFIDAIDPVGTLNPGPYEMIGRIFAETSAYEKYIGGELCQDVAVYLSTESKFDFADNGKTVGDQGVSTNQLSTKTPHVDAVVNVCKSLIDANIPFGVIGGKNLSDLARHKVLVLPNVLMMDKEEASAIRQYVRQGGAVYASKYTSLVTKDGVVQDSFMLSDVLGVSYASETKENYTYIAPADSDNALFEAYSEKYPFAIESAQIRVTAGAGTRVLGYTVLPYTDPAEPRRYSSIHSNPPGVYTNDPAIVLNRFGDGRAIYTAGDLENNELYRGIFASIIRMLGGEFSFESDAPKCVEITMFHQADTGRYLISLVNSQKELPNIPVDGVNVRVDLGGKSVKRLLLLPGEQEMEFKMNGGYAEFTVPMIDTFRMVALDYEVQQ